MKIIVTRDEVDRLVLSDSAEGDASDVIVVSRAKGNSNLHTNRRATSSG
jgi:hypothetical protein